MYMLQQWQPRYINMQFYALHLTALVSYLKKYSLNWLVKIFKTKKNIKKILIFTLKFFDKDEIKEI